MNYVFLDEIQLLDNFERLLDGLHIPKNVDLLVGAMPIRFRANLPQFLPAVRLYQYLLFT